MDAYPVYAFEDKDWQAAYVRAGVGSVLNQEGLVNDLVFQVNRHRRAQGYTISDRIILSLGVSPELWWAIHFNKERLLSKTLSTKLVFVDELEVSENSFELVSLGERDKSFECYVSSVEDRGE